MNNPESVLENETHKILWDFEIQTDHLISARPQNLVNVSNNKKKKKEKKKRTYQIADFGFLADHRVKLNEGEKRDKYLDLARELKKTTEHERDSNSNCNWCVRYSHRRICTETGGLGNKQTSGDNPDYSIIKIGPNTEKNPGNLKRLRLQWKTIW